MSAPLVIKPLQIGGNQFAGTDGDMLLPEEKKALRRWVLRGAPPDWYRLGLCSPQ